MFSKILCATKLIKKNNPEIRKAVELAHQFDSMIILLNVNEGFMDKGEMEMLRVSVDTMQLEFEKTAILAKNEMKGRLHTLHAEDVRVDFVLKKGKPKVIICEEAKRNECDLIIIGKTSKSNISNLILGSAASHIANNADIPVLFIP